MTAGGPELAVYVHWPFCLSKCPYCDFNSHVRERIDEAGWRDALLRELDHYADRAPERTVTSIFFGGGTPSLMTPETVGAVIDRVARRWTLAGDAEITLEANPNSVEAARFEGYRAAGVNRVSLGVQSLHDHALAFLGRRHSAAEARAAVALAGRHFPRYSFDLIYALPGQDAGAWRADLAEAVAMAGDHLSLYQLTLEPGTAFYTAAARGDLVLPEGDDAAALYAVTQEVLGAANMPAYEISNHAAPGGESRHNLTYWRCGDYIGVGPGAHGRLTEAGETRALRQHRAPETWLDAVARDGHGTREDVAVDGAARAAEILMMGLRLSEGVSAANFAARSGASLDDTLDPARLDPLVEGGFVTVDMEGSAIATIRATPAGMPVLDSVLAALLA